MRQPLLSLTRFLFLLLLAAAVSSCSFRQAHVAASQAGGNPAGPGAPALVGYQPGDTVARRIEVPLERSQRSFFVHAIFNGKMPARLLLDTGAAYLTIHEEMARELGIDLAVTEPVTCILADGSQSVSHRAYLTQVALGEAVLRNVPVLVMPTRPNASHDGLLGMSFLERFVVELNSDACVLSLTSRSPALPR